ncbi:hypothetical protein [Chondromyces crocatus]|uniref:Uncharacterized protein n=1 Tax=Chondromyces crocatus TaxID=52 RepID=A0A0K1ECN3_CHOCO|nr:hypothetical protein [Chondromyces crocatus]AKT38625.1 uncharacterized protein CMC5_027720 [Chondromyces crocatus]
MAADKPTKRKRKSPGTAADVGGAFLRQRSDPRKERRFENSSSVGAVLTMVGGSLAALALGAGVFGQWFRGDGTTPHPYALHLLGAGVAFAIAILLFGQWGSLPVRVGDAGVAVERGTEVERLGWHDVQGVLLGGGALTFRGAGMSIVIPLRSQPEAAARALAEARTRIPARVKEIDEKALPAPSDAAGQVLSLEPPQIAGLRCKSSDKLISFERDARLCGRCGELYHKDDVPRRCVTCDAPLLG